MAVAFRSSTMVTSTGVGNKPTGLADNDVMIAITAGNANFGTSTITPPSGWTVVPNTSVDDATSIRAYYKVVSNAAGEPSTYNFQNSAAAYQDVIIHAYSGVHTSTPIVDSDSVTTASTASPAMPDLTMTVANCMYVTGMIHFNSTTPPGTLTERHDNDGMTTADGIFASSGATGTQTFTMGAAAVVRGVALGLQPAATVQVARPTADVSVSTWTTDAGGTSNLYATLDETASSDTDYVRSASTTSGTSEVKIRLGALTDPAVGTGHVVRYRYGKDVGSSVTTRYGCYHQCR